MSNIRHGLLINEGPPLLLKNSRAHFDMRSDFTADCSQLKEASTEFTIQSLFHAGARKRFVAKAGLEIKSNMVGYPQIDNSAVGQTTIGEFGQINPGSVSNIGNFDHPGGAYVFPFNRWNMVGHGTLTPSTEIASYPATNTYLQQRSKVWRSTSTTASLTRDLANPYRINSFCIVSHNLTKDGTFRVRIGNDSTFTTNKYDSGTQRIWEPSFSLTGPYAEEAIDSGGPVVEGVGGGGYPTNELIDLLRYCGENPRVVRWVTFNEINARYIKVDFEDATNSRGLIEVAYIYVGLCVLVRPDQVYGWTLIPVSNSRVKKSSSGSPWTDVMFRQVMINATFSPHPEPSTLAFWGFLGAYLGRRREFIVSFQPDNLPRKFYFTLFGRFKEVPQIENIALKSYSVPLEIEELVG